MPAIRRIVDIGQLQENWDSYGAQPIRPFAIVSIIRWLMAVMRPQMFLPQVVPTAEGGLQAEWHEAKIDLEVAFSPEGRISAWCEDRESKTEWESDITSDALPIIPYLTRLVRPR